MGGRKERNKKAAIRRALEKERRKLLPVKREEDGEEEVFVVFSFNAPLGSLGGLELCHLFFLLLWGLT